MSHQHRAFARLVLPQIVTLFTLIFLASSAAQAQTTQRVRGTITGLEGNMLSVKTREGKDVKLMLSEKTVVVASKALKLEELKPGEYVGATTQARPDGSMIAVEVHSISATAKPGHFEWDLQPGSMMTNGNVTGAVTQTSGGHELKLDHQTGSRTIVVAPGTPIVTTIPADRAALKPGETIFTTAAVATDGAMTVQRIQVSRDGVKPPQ
ncbi:MAG: hypothetical protein V4637_20440 [Pseudomonadota bacterium]